MVTSRSGMAGSAVGEAGGEAGSKAGGNAGGNGNFEGEQHFGNSFCSEVRTPQCYACLGK